MKPVSGGIVVTSHDAFQYFGRDYGLTFLAPQELSTESEASAQDVARLIEHIRDEGISAVFVENVTDRRLLEQIANETGATIGGTLYPDALSGPDGPAPTYLDMMRHNVMTLTRAQPANVGQQPLATDQSTQAAEEGRNVGAELPGVAGRLVGPAGGAEPAAQVVEHLVLDGDLEGARRPPVPDKRAVVL